MASTDDQLDAAGTWIGRGTTGGRACCGPTCGQTSQAGRLRDPTRD